MSLADDSRTAVRRLALNVKTVVPKGATVLTHGPSSTVREALSALAERNIEVIVTECRPGFGGRETACKLAGWGISTVLITDAQMGLALRDADCVLVGAESILADGTVVNQVGTYLLALAAHDRGVPLYVCCESFKRHGSSDSKPVFREGSGAELGVGATEGLRVRNLCVDATPGWLVTGWINESGVCALQGD
jgi:translation initiation factor 2B subunit (eIF-2B alpha/beta/delta family)